MRQFGLSPAQLQALSRRAAESVGLLQSARSLFGSSNDEGTGAAGQATLQSALMAFRDEWGRASNTAVHRSEGWRDSFRSASTAGVRADDQAAATQHGAASGADHARSVVRRPISGPMP